jgi:sec-independent protein translocase protein TatA
MNLVAQRWQFGFNMNLSTRWNEVNLMSPLFGFFNLGTQEILILLALGVLLFGRKLPEVGRYLGKGIVEFKKGIKGLEDDVEGGTAARQDQVLEAPRPPQRVSATAPKFEDNAVSNPPQG